MLSIGCNSYYFDWAFLHLLYANFVYPVTVFAYRIIPSKRGSDWQDSLGKRLQNLEHLNANNWQWVFTRKCWMQILLQSLTHSEAAFFRYKKFLVLNFRAQDLGMSSGNQEVSRISSERKVKVTASSWMRWMLYVRFSKTCLTYSLILNCFVEYLCTRYSSPFHFTNWISFKFVISRVNFWL